MTDDYNTITNPQHYIFNNPCPDVISVIEDRLRMMIFYTAWPPETGYAYTNIIKYILRAPLKNKLEDLKKSKFLLDRMIDCIEQDRGDDIPF